MAKTTTCVSINTELHKLAKKRGVNVSSLLNKSLSILLNNKTSSTLSYDQALLDEQLLQNKILGLQAELSKVQNVISDYKDNQIIKEKERLVKQSRQLKKSKTCVNCKELIGSGSKLHKFPLGLICNACFLSSNKESIKKWNKQR